MKVNSKKILITTASHEILIVRRGRREKVRALCPACATQVEMLTLDDAVSASGRPARELMRKIEAGTIHSIETQGGHLLVCKISLGEICRIEGEQER